MALTPEQEALDFNPELQGVSRERKLADLLMAKGMQGQPQGQMISGYYVAPSWSQQLNPMANMLAGEAVGGRADIKQNELAQALRVQGNAAVQKVMQDYQQNPQLGLQTASALSQYPQVKALLPQLSKVALPEATTLEREYSAAKAQGFKGTINDFKNQMSEKDKADLRIQNARLGLAQQEQAFNLGLPMAGVGVSMPTAPQAPLQTINPGSPILAPGQQLQQTGITQQPGMPAMQAGQPPRFTSKAQQDAWLAGEKKKSELQAEAVNALPGALQTAEMGLQTINGLIGDTTVDAKGNIVYGKTRPHPGFEGAVGISGLGSGFGAAGFIPGTDVKDFQSRFKQIEGQAFLGAIGTLRGTGAISEVEGAKATAALNRMSLAQSEKEFIQAANEFKSILQKGYSSAQQRAGVAPINYNATPSVGGATPKYVYDPATGTLK